MAFSEAWVVLPEDDTEWQIVEVKTRLLPMAESLQKARTSSTGCLDDDVSTASSMDEPEPSSVPSCNGGLTQEQADDVMRWLIEGNEHERAWAIMQIAGQARVLAGCRHGTRVVQKVAEMAKPEVRLLMARQFMGHVMDAVKSADANFVLQQTITLVPSESLKFVVEEMQGKAVIIARNRFGCRVMQRVIEHFSQDSIAGILLEIMSDAPRLAKHPYGNFVLQHILEHGTQEQQSAIVDLLVVDTVSLAKHRISSHVVQKAWLQSCSFDRERLEHSICSQGEEAVRQLAHSQYGSFVVREMTGRR